MFLCLQPAATVKTVLLLISPNGLKFCGAVLGQCIKLHPSWPKCWQFIGNLHAAFVRKEWKFIDGISDRVAGILAANKGNSDEEFN